MFFRKKMQKKSPFAWTFMGLEPIDNDTVALGAWRLTDILENLRDDTPPAQVRQMLPYYYKKSQG